MSGGRGPSPGRMAPGEVAGSLSNARLHLILMPTEACNFRCVYCYEEFRRARMGRPVVAGLKRLLDRRAGELRRLDLSWFGGEPLLALDIIEEVMEHVRGLRAEFPLLEAGSDMTTNAYMLTAPRATRLLALGVRDFQVPFDGPRTLHDRKRILRGGRGTFDRVWGNLCGLRRQTGTFHVTIRLHLDRENEPAIPEFLDLVAGEFGSDSRFDLFARPLSRFGGPRDRSLPTFESEEGKAAVERVRRLATARGIPLAGESFDPGICYAARGNSFLVRADGTLNKCTIALNHPANQIGHLREDGTVEIDSARVQPWLRGLFSGVEEELACPMRGLADPPARVAGGRAEPARPGGDAPHGLTEAAPARNDRSVSH